MYTQKEFIEKSRTKFPEFQNIDDSQVLKTMLEKYPIYKNQISDYKEKGLLEKSLDYGLETGGKILKGLDSAVADTMNLTLGNAARGLGYEYNQVSIAEAFGLAEPGSRQEGFISRAADNFGNALDATWQGAKARQQRLNSQRDDNSFSGIVKGDLKNMGSSFRTAFDFGGNLLGAFNNTIGDGLMSAGATLIPDETQEEIKGYIAEKISESETLTNLVQKIEEYGEIVEYMKENAPEDYATHKASIGFLEGFLDLATAKTGDLAIKGAKNAYNSSLKITKNMINKASDELNKIAPLKEKYFSKVNIDDLKEKGKDAFKFSKENIEGISPVTGKKFEIEKTPGIYNNITDAVIGATDNEVLATKSIFPKLTKEKSATAKINAGKTALEGVEQLYDDFANGIIKSDIHTMQGGVEGVSEALEHWGKKIGDLTKVDGNIDFTPELKNFSKILDDKTFAFSGKAGKFAENIIKNFENVGNNLSIKETQQVLSNLKAELFSSAENINIFNKSETGRQVLNFVDNITKKLDSTIENLAGNSTELKTAKTNYAKYKKIEKDLLNSFLVDARKNTNGLAGLSGDMMSVYDILKNPLNVGNTLQAMAFKHIGNLMGKNSSRGGAWEKLIRNLDRQAVKKAGVDDGGKFFTKNKPTGGKEHIKSNYKNVDSSKYKNLTDAEAEEIVKKYFKDEVGVEFLEKIKTREGLEALGRYKDELIEFAKNPKENVVHHEALHAYFDLTVEPKKQREILDLIKKDKNFKTDLDAEEWLADSFADFVIGRQDVSKISFRLKNFLSDLAFKFKKFFGREDKVEALFRDLEDIGKGKKEFEKVNFGNKNDEKYFSKVDDEILKEYDENKFKEFVEYVKEYQKMPLESEIRYGFKEKLSLFNPETRGKIDAIENLIKREAGFIDKEKVIKIPKKIEKRNINGDFDEETINFVKKFDSGEEMYQKSGIKGNEIFDSYGLETKQEKIDFWEKVRKSKNFKEEKKEVKIFTSEAKIDKLYHGTNIKNLDSILKNGFKKGSELGNEVIKGGGYGAKQDSISFSTNPKKASVFGTTYGPEGVIFEVKPTKKLKIARIEGIDYAEELNGHILDLKKKGYDAVDLLDNGEDELVILNSNAIEIIKHKKYKVNDKIDWNKEFKAEKEYKYMVDTSKKVGENNEINKIRNNLENVAKKYDVDLSDISLTNNDFKNSLNILSKVNSKIPKGTGKQTDLSKQMYQEKIDNIIELIKFVKNEKKLGNLNITYKWDYDKKINMPYILFKEGKFFKSYHVKEKYMKKIKAIVK